MYVFVTCWLAVERPAGRTVEDNDKDNCSLGRGVLIGCVISDDMVCY